MTKDKAEKKRFTSYLTIETHEELHRLSDLTRVPQSSLVEEAMIDLFMKYYGKFRHDEK